MKYLFSFLLLVSFFSRGQQKQIRIVFIADLHFGLERHFRDKDSVSSFEVNRAMAASIRSLGKIDAIIVGGDIANRQQNSIQSASTSWKQFEEVYKPLHIQMILMPGNHDISNAIGYYKPMQPLVDRTSLAGIYYNIHHSILDTAHFHYKEEDYDFSKNIGGIHFLFLNLWPDSTNIAWMEKDLQKTGKMPVLIFAHDPPEGDYKQFTLPVEKPQDVNQEKFESILPEIYNDHYEKDWDNFLKSHPTIKGYFHGHSNYQEFYTYKGVNGDLALPCFRTDSPMKGKFSSKDESLLSFMVITIFPEKKIIEVKPYLWNKGKRPLPENSFKLQLSMD